MSFHDQDLETPNRSELRLLQEEKLRRLLVEIGGNPFYREKLTTAGIDPKAIQTLADLARLPFTHKKELVAAQETHSPYGNLLTYPIANYRYLHQTSGTSGQPLLWLDTEESWRTWVRCWGQVYRGAGVRDGDVVFCAFSFGPFVAHWSALAGARALGLMAMAGGGLTSLQRLERILQHGVTVVVSTPTYALHLAEVASEHGLDLAGSGVRITIHAGEPGASIPAVKQKIQAAWGARAFDHAGATEIGAWGFDCQADDIDLHVNELEFICEVVNPETEEPVEDGERGELVMTNLGRHGMPVLRYRTGDLVTRTRQPCTCGRHMARLLGGVVGRADDMLIVRGVNVFPSAVDNLVRGIPEIAEYEVEVRRSESMDELTVKVEMSSSSPSGTGSFDTGSFDTISFETVRERLASLFRSRLGIRVTVVEAGSGTLPRYELKAMRFKRIE